MTAKKLHKDGHCTSIDDNLSLLCRARRDICESPGGLELNKCVWGMKEFHEACDDTGLNDPFNGRVSLFR